MAAQQRSHNRRYENGVAITWQRMARNIISVVSSGGKRSRRGVALSAIKRQLAYLSVSGVVCAYLYQHQ